MLDQIAHSVPSNDPTTVKILGAALEEFLNVGIRRARMEEIARRAGVSRVTVHRRFPTKQDLVTAVLIGEVRVVYLRGREIAAAQETLPDKLAAAFVAVLEFARSGPLTPLVTGDPGPFLPSFTVHGEPLIALMRAFYLELLRDAGIAFPEMEQATDVLARVVVSYCLSPHSQAVDLTTPEAAAAFAHRHLAPIILPFTSPTTR